MTALPAELDEAPAGVSAEVLLSGVAFSAGLAASSYFTFTAPTGPAFAVMVGWSAFGFTAGVLLDRRPGGVEGRFLLGLCLVPVFNGCWAILRTSTSPEPAELARALHELAGLQALLVAVVLPWLFGRGVANPRLVVIGAGATLGAAVIAVSTVSGLDRRLETTGWVLLGAGAVAVWAEILVQSAARDRTQRRRTAWLVCLIAASAVAVGSGWQFLADDVAAYLTLTSLIVIAVAVPRLHLLDSFRPIDEPVLDALAALAALLAASAIGALVWAGAVWIDLPSPLTPAAFGSLLTLAVAAPTAVWVRRSAIARRYGSGIISPDDVARITADLHARTDPRDLLAKAARMVGAAASSAEVRIVLGTEPPELRGHEALYPLVVGGDQVGLMVVTPTDHEGFEPRQHRVIEQLVPTVALVARAVGLAVETEHARLDVTREREAERRRILNELHDLLGPVLAGMSMRVQGAMRTQGDPAVIELLRALSADLATSRADLRRIVSGLTPSALQEGGLEPALTQLLGSFNGAASGPRVSWEFAATAAIPQDAEVTVYRMVAEGVTNAVRHAAAHAVEVRLRTTDQKVLVDVTDDGTGGPVHPGVGLTSLTQRAEALGGCLRVGRSATGGVGLHLELPLDQEVLS